MKSLYNKALSSGVLFSFNSEVDLIARENKGYVVGIKNEDYRFFSKIVINSAGLSSDRVADLAGIDADKAGYRLQYIKGSYFAYARKSPVSMLVYPLPSKERHGLGIHATIDTGSRLRFGPDSECVDSIDYTVDSRKGNVFFENVSRYMNGLDRDAFVPDMAGIRPAIKGEGFHDFIIRHETERGLAGLVNIIGIESPGLTASLSLAKRVRNVLKET
jgi:L-2-hydroxyglutarate oxidase LhgO